MKKYCLPFLLPAILSSCSSTDRQAHIEREQAPKEDQPAQARLIAIWECRDSVYDDQIALELGKADITVGQVVTEGMGEILESHGKSIEELANDERLTEALNGLEQFYAGFIRLAGEEREPAFYHRQGLNHRWEWGDGYTFIIEPSGRGYYYDFTQANEGESVSPSYVFKCERN